MLQELVDQHLDDARSGWSMGAPGAIAEFVRTPDEAFARGPGSIVTDRGGIRITPAPGCVAIAYETPAGPHDHWNHAVALCPPTGAAQRAGRTVITELGPDPDPLRDRDAAAVLFDLGLGTPTVDACVRTADPELIASLRAAEASKLFEPGSTVAARIVAACPHRVFTTACGRVEVYAAIPPPDGRSPDGPHTHLLLNLIRQGRTHAATVPIPDGHLPCAHLYPPHPLSDAFGQPRQFDPDLLDAFAELLHRYGDPHQARISAAVAAAVRAGAGPESIPAVTDPPGRAAVAVAVRKLAHTAGAPADVLARWRRHHLSSDVHDPAGDRNAG
jgi:hypothetical protein